MQFYFNIIYFIRKTVKCVEAFLLSFRHGMQLEEKFRLNPRLCLPCLNDPTKSAYSIQFKEFGIIATH